MKTKVLLVLAALLALAASACSNGTAGTNPPGPGDNPGDNPGQQGGAKYAAGFRGEWIRMDTGQRWYIAGDSIKVDGSGSAPEVSLQKSSDNVITATGANNDKFTLFAARTANAGFTARVVLLDDASRSVTGRDAVGGSGQRPPIKITNPKQPDLSVVLQPNPNTGEITVPNQIPGDLIELAPDSPEWSGVKVGITPGFDSDQNMGVIPITQGDNFKVSVRMKNSTDDITELYADLVPRDYIFELENVGATTCGDTGWELSWNDADFTYISGDTKENFANIAPGGKKQLTVKLAPRQVDAETKSKEVKIKIRNYDSKSKQVREWEDAVSINYNKVLVPLRFSSRKQVQGVIKSKKGKSYYFKTARTGTTGNFTATVGVPWSGEEYIVAFLGATVESGSATEYSFAVDDTPPSDWNSFDIWDFLRTYKPANEDEKTAPVLDLTRGDKSFTGYLAGDSIDYYKVRLTYTPPETQTYTVTFNANGATGAAPLPITLGPNVAIPLPGQGNLAKAGNYFHGWNTSSSGGGTRYSAGSTYTITGNITLYAEWDTSLEAWLSWLKTNAESNRTYDFTVSADESFGSQSLFYTDKTNVTIHLQGDTAMRTLSLSGSSGTIFGVGSGVTLILDNNITLRGTSNNSYPLARVDSGGKLEMRGSSRITGNTCLSGYHQCGGVKVNGGTFTMSGGEISGNSVTYADQCYGGGVCLDSGSFTMSGGKISGNSVTCTGDTNRTALGGGVCVWAGSFTMSGGEISGNTASSTYYAYGGGVYVYTGDGGSFSKTGGTIYGYTSGDSNSNTVKVRSSVQSTYGHAACVINSSNTRRYRDTTAGSTVNLSSSSSSNWN